MSVFTVGVTFQRESSKEYDYLCRLEGIKTGDKVIVQTYDDSVELATIARVHDVKSSKANKWAFQKVDLETNMFLVEARNEAVRIKKFLVSRAEELAKKKAYEELFASDPESAKMVERLKELDLW